LSPGAAARWCSSRSRRARIIAAAELWLAHRPDDAQRDIRFDVMLVTPGRIPKHIVNAFDATC
jgi:putative endonuclease